MKEKYIHDIYYDTLDSCDGYESYCYQNCQRIIVEHRYGAEALMMINTALSIEETTENEIKIKEKKGMRSLLPSLDKCTHRLYYNLNENEEKIFKDNIKFIFKEKQPIVVGADTFYLPHSNNYRKKHAKHTMILCGYDLEKGVVYIIDWYKPWAFKGEMSIENFLEARNSMNADDGSFYSGTPIGNNWAYIEPIEKYDIDELFAETIVISRNNYFNFNNMGIINTLLFVQKYIDSLEEENVFERIFFEIYTFINRKKIFLEYIELYSKLKSQNDYNDFIDILKTNIFCWDVFTVLLLKQSKRYNEKTRIRIVNKMSELIEEERNLIEKFEEIFEKIGENYE